MFARWRGILGLVLLAAPAAAVVESAAPGVEARVDVGPGAATLTFLTAPTPSAALAAPALRLAPSAPSLLLSAPSAAAAAAAAADPATAAGPAAAGPAAADFAAAIPPAANPAANVPAPTTVAAAAVSNERATAPPAFPRGAAAAFDAALSAESAAAAVFDGAPAAAAEKDARLQMSWPDAGGLRGARKREALFELTLPTRKTFWGDRVHVWAFGALSVPVLWHAAASTHGAAVGLGTAAAWGAGLLAAEPLTRVFHKIFDDWMPERVPVLGPIARDFRYHHVNPANLNQVSALDNMASFAKLAAPVLAVLALLPWLGLPSPRPWMAAFVQAALAGAILALETHRWAHQRAAGKLGGKAPGPGHKLIMALQDRGILIEHGQHVKHHRNPHNTRFSVFLGERFRWLGGGERETAFWAALDGLFFLATRAMPNDWKLDPGLWSARAWTFIERDPALIPADTWRQLESTPARAVPRLRGLLARRPELGTPELRRLLGLSGS